MDNDDRDLARDSELGMNRPITRRDFLNGVAIGISGTLAARWLPGAGGSAEAAGAAQGVES